MGLQTWGAGQTGREAYEGCYLPSGQSVTAP